MRTRQYSTRLRLLAGAVSAAWLVALLPASGVASAATTPTYFASIDDVALHDIQGVIEKTWSEQCAEVFGSLSLIAPGGQKQVYFSEPPKTPKEVCEVVKPLNEGKSRATIQGNRPDAGKALLATLPAGAAFILSCHLWDADGDNVSQKLCDRDTPIPAAGSNKGWTHKTERYRGDFKVDVLTIDYSVGPAFDIASRQDPKRGPFVPGQRVLVVTNLSCVVKPGDDRVPKITSPAFVNFRTTRGLAGAYFAQIADVPTDSYDIHLSCPDAVATGTIQVKGKS